ncbi:pyruvate-binding protein [Pseudomonadota bacterium]
MNIITNRRALVLAVAGGALLSLSSGAMASIPGAVGPYAVTFDGGDNDIAPGETITATEVFAQVNDGYTGDPVYNYSANAFLGQWFTFEMLGSADVTVDVTSLSFSGSFSPGITVWANGANEFDGGSMFIGTETSTSGHNSPTSFNVTGAIGDPGTLWMADGVGGNMIETLGYAVSGPSAPSGTGWGESILYGAHDVSATNSFESGVSGSVSAPGLSYNGPFGPVFGDHFAELTFTDLQPGWYTVFVGGADTTQTGALFDLTVSAVPEMETWAMMLAGMGFLAWRARREQGEATSLPA